MSNGFVTQIVGLGILLIGLVVSAYEIIAHKNWTPMATCYAAFIGMLLIHYSFEQDDKHHRSRTKRAR